MQAGLGPTEKEVFAELSNSNKFINRAEFDARSEDVSSQQLGIEMWKEPRQKRRFRNVMFWTFFLLLLAQHGLLVWFISAMVSMGYVESTQGMLGVIVSATLFETYKIFQTMVKFIFSPGNFGHLSKNTTNNSNSLL